MFGVNISGKRNPHPSVIPAELCRVIPGQLYKRKVPEYLTAKVVEFAKIKPQDRFRKISQSVSFSPFVFISAAQINVILGRSVPPFRIRRGIWHAD
jgi:eukaryotic translation initiation factor 2C